MSFGTIDDKKDGLGTFMAVGILACSTSLALRGGSATRTPDTWSDMALGPVVPASNSRAAYPALQSHRASETVGIEGRQAMVGRRKKIQARSQRPSGKAIQPRDLLAGQEQGPEPM